MKSNRFGRSKYGVGHVFDNGMKVVETGILSNNGKPMIKVLCHCGEGHRVDIASRFSSKNRINDCDHCNPTKGDITGKRYGKLLCKGLSNGKVKRSHSLWDFVCDCGYTIKFRKEAISGGRRSCGCDDPATAIGSKSLPVETAGVTRGGKPRYRSRYDKAIAEKIRTYRNNAKRRGFHWNLSGDLAYELFMGACFYCGQPGISHGDSNGFNGIDRIDSASGYTSDNCRPCCSLCNWMKKDMSVSQFSESINRLYLNMGNWACS